MHTRVSALAAAVLLATGIAAYGDLTHPFEYTSTSGGALEASVKFEASGGNLLLTLTNTSLYDVLTPGDVLTAVFFDLSGAALTPVSAILYGGSTVLFDAHGQPAGGNVGGEWAYRSGLVGAPRGATQGISSAGLGLFGASNFGGADLDPPYAVDGLNYGLLSAGDDTATGNAKVTGGTPLVKNSVQFTLSGLSGVDLTQITISNISFQYGTSLAEPNIISFPPDVPAPGAALLGVIGLGLVGWVKRRCA